jgi:hypothetical protein
MSQESRAKSRPSSPEVDAGGERSWRTQLRAELAQLSYAQQLERVRPPALRAEAGSPLAGSLSGPSPRHGSGGPGEGGAVQLQEDGEGASAGDAESAAKPTVEVENEFPDLAKKDKARTTVGVGEKAWFTTSLEGGKWSASGGKGKTDDRGYEWVAPDIAGPCTIAYTLKNQSVTVTMTVVAPTDIRGQKTGEYAGYQTGAQGSGMTLDLVTQPETVSFVNLGWHEKQGAISGTGVFAKKQPSIKHNPGWSLMEEGNDISDTAEMGGQEKPWSPGVATYHIKEMYRVGQGAGKVYKVLVQEHEILDNEGTSVTRKAGQSSAPRKP